MRVGHGQPQSDTSLNLHFDENSHSSAETGTLSLCVGKSMPQGELEETAHKLFSLYKSKKRWAKKKQKQGRQATDNRQRQRAKERGGEGDGERGERLGVGKDDE